MNGSSLPPANPGGPANETPDPPTVDTVAVSEGARLEIASAPESPRQIPATPSEDPLDQRFAHDLTHHTPGAPSQRLQGAEFAGFYQAEARTLFRRLWLVTGNSAEAEELMQDAFTVGRSHPLLERRGTLEHQRRRLRRPSRRRRDDPGDWLSP